MWERFVPANCEETVYQGWGSDCSRVRWLVTLHVLSGSGDKIRGTQWLSSSLERHTSSFVTGLWSVKKQSVQAPGSPVTFHPMALTCCDDSPPNQRSHCESQTSLGSRCICVSHGAFWNKLGKREPTQSSLATEGLHKWHVQLESKRTYFAS